MEWTEIMPLVTMVTTLAGVYAMFRRMGPETKALEVGMLAEAAIVGGEVWRLAVAELRAKVALQGEAQATMLHDRLKADIAHDRQISSLEGKIGDLEEKLEKRNEELRRLREAVKALEKENKRLNAENDKLRSRIRTLESKGDEKT